MKKFFAAVVLLIIVSVGVSAEEKSVYSEFNDALGGFAGEFGGSGLSYQHWFGSLGLQTAVGIFYYPEDSSLYQSSYDGTSYDLEVFTYNLGVEGQLMLYENTYNDWFSGNLHLFAGITHTGSIRKTITYTGEVVTPTGGADPYTEYTVSGETGPLFYPGASVGFGIGFEPVFFQHFSVPLEFGLGGSWEFDSIVPVSAGLRVQGGLRYRF
jgi:hypothetical protein